MTSNMCHGLYKLN